MKISEYPDVLNVKEASQLLRVCSKTIYKLLRENKIEHIRIGTEYKIPKVCVLEYLKIQNDSKKPHHEK